MPPEVSVIIPVYNVAPYLRPCLESVLGQTFADLEVICVDDDSSDASPDILADYAGKDSRLRVLAQEHGGQARARTKALALAQGRYISFVDSDDLLNREAYEKSLPHFTDDVDYVCFRIKVFGEAGLTAKERGKRYRDPPFQGLVDVDEAVIRQTNVQVWNKIYRRKVIERNGVAFPDGLIYEDFVFTLAYLLVSRRAWYLEDRLYNYRQRPDSTMGRTYLSSCSRVTEHLAVVRELFKFMKAHELLSGRESFLAEYFVRHFHLTCQYAPAESREEMYALAGQCLKELLEADLQGQNAVLQALLRDMEKNRRKLKQIVASRWHRVGRKLGLVKLLKDMG
jgi:glycosyltransferase involved in cell wall biosynthesis